jgi:hypothetical protein
MSRQSSPSTMREAGVQELGEAALAFAAEDVVGRKRERGDALGHFAFAVGAANDADCFRGQLLDAVQQRGGGGGLLEGGGEAGDAVGAAGDGGGGFPGPIVNALFEIGDGGRREVGVAFAAFQQAFDDHFVAAHRGDAVSGPGEEALAEQGRGGGVGDRLVGDLADFGGQGHVEVEYADFMAAPGGAGL